MKSQQWPQSKLPNGLKHSWDGDDFNVSQFFLVLCNWSLKNLLRNPNTLPVGLLDLMKWLSQKKVGKHVQEDLGKNAEASLIKRKFC